MSSDKKEPKEAQLNDYDLYKNIIDNLKEKSKVSYSDIEDYMKKNNFELIEGYKVDDEDFIKAYKNNKVLVEIFKREPLDLLGNKLGDEDYIIMKIRSDNIFAQYDFRPRF